MEKRVNNPEPEAAVNEAIAKAQKSLNEIQQTAERALGPSESANEVSDGLEEGALQSGEKIGGLDLLHDVDLNVTIELGRTEMLVEDVLKLGTGSVVELDKLAGDPVDVYVNQKLVARGEVLVLNDNFCIRISEIVADLEQQAQAAAEQHAPTS